MKIEILPSALADLADGYVFYEKQSSGLGSYFLDSLDRKMAALPGCERL